MKRQRRASAFALGTTAEILLDDIKSSSQHLAGGNGPRKDDVTLTFESDGDNGAKPAIALARN